MLKTLEWSFYKYDSQYKAYQAKIAQINFIQSTNSFNLCYLIVEEDFGKVSLYLECCNDPLFIIGSYNSLAIAFIEANKHHEELVMSMFLVPQL